ncbi:MAG TPA: MFS transporter [Dongiaceae bacterium]
MTPPEGSAADNVETAAPLNRQALIAIIGSVGLVALIYSIAAPLLALSLERQGFSSIVNGLLAAMPSVAILLTGAFIPVVVRQFGAITSIALGTALAVTALMLFPVIGQIEVWFVLRFIMGASIGMIWVISETWLNAMARPESRGRLIGIYVTVLSAGSASGPVLVGLMGSEGIRPFWISAAILAIAMLPIPFAARGGHVPTFHHRASISLLRALERSPAVMISAFIHGATTLTALTLMPVYGVRTGLSEKEALLALTAIVVGGMLAQIPIGHLLDRMNAGRVLMFSGTIQFVCAALLPFTIQDDILRWPLLVVWGGLGAGVYTTALTLLGRSYHLDELPNANTAFTMTWELGALAGPIVAGFAMSFWNPHGMLAVHWLGGAALVLLGLFITREYRAQRIANLPNPPAG